MKPEFLYKIPDGDGVGDFFSQPIYLKRTEAKWFGGHVRDGFGDAILFQVVKGRFSGEYIALTSRTLIHLDKQLYRYGWASVIVHRIKNPSTSFQGSESDAFPVGMATVEIVGWKQGPIAPADWPKIPNFK